AGVVGRADGALARASAVGAGERRGAGGAAAAAIGVVALGVDATHAAADVREVARRAAGAGAATRLHARAVGAADGGGAAAVVLGDAADALAGDALIAGIARVRAIAAVERIG